MGLEDTKRTSENDHSMFVKAASPTGMKSWRCPCSVPRVHGCKKPYSSGRDCKENAALRRMTNLHVAQSSTSFLPRTQQAGEARGRKQKMRRVTSSAGAPSTWAILFPLALRASLVLWWKKTWFLAERCSTLHREPSAEKEEAQTLHPCPLLHSPQESIFNDF